MKPHKHPFLPMTLLLVALFAVVFLAVAMQGAEVATGPTKSHPVYDLVIYGDSSGAVTGAMDEFTDNGGWPWMIYIREARRMVGDYVMTQHDCEGRKSAVDPVALGSFDMDSHGVQHFVTESGHANSDGVIWRVPPKPYGIACRSILPRKGECKNLVSPICVSASHVAHGSIRMERVFMALSQSAAIAAGMAIDGKVSVQEVAYPAWREKLEAAKQIVRPEACKDSGSRRKFPPPKNP